MIQDVNLDIDRCNNIIEEKNYLEMVIAIEELRDKYRGRIQSIDEDNSDMVWNYKREDLITIKEKLISYKEDLIFEKKQKDINEKIDEFRLYIENSSISNKDDLFKIIKDIEIINQKESTLEEKYHEIKDYLKLAHEFHRETSLYILELILLVIK